MSFTPISRVADKQKGGFHMEPLSLCMSNGFMQRGSSMFLSGDPGAGKTTMLLQSLSFASEYVSRPIAFCTTEQSLSAIARVFSRLDLRTNMIHVSTSQNVEELIDFVEKNRCSIAVLDSLNCANIARLAKGETVQAGVARALCKLAMDTDCVSIGIRQINKEGDAAGEVAIEHLPDCNVHLSFDEKTGIRTLSVKKNRNGEAPYSVQLKMTNKGLIQHG